MSLGYFFQFGVLVFFIFREERQYASYVQMAADCSLELISVIDSSQKAISVILMRQDGKIGKDTWI